RYCPRHGNAAMVVGPNGKRWWSDAFVSHQQWVLFHKTHCYPLLYWIVQGDQGGHKRKLTSAEKMLLKINGSPQLDVPAPGQLPYADFDNRVLDQLALRDKLRTWDRATGQGWETRSSGIQVAKTIVASERQALEVETRWKLYEWLKKQV